MCFDARDGKLLWNNATDQLDMLFQGDPERAEAVRAQWVAALREYEVSNTDTRGMKDKAKASAIKAKQKALDAKAAEFGEKYGLLGLRNRAQGNTWATPVSDGRRVWTAWAPNTAACYDLADGSPVWMEWFGPVRASGNGLRKSDRSQSSSWNERWVPSPVLADGVLVTSQGAVLRGVDAEAGTLLWEQPLNRNRDVYVEHDKQVRRDGPTGHWGCGTPVVLDVGGMRVVVTSRGRAYRVSDGKVVCGYIGAMADVGGNSPVAADRTDTVFLFDHMDGKSGAETKKA